MKVLFALLVSFSSIAFGYENRCTVGRESNLNTLLVDGRVVEYFRSLDDAILSINQLRNAGFCNSISSNCTMGRENNLITLIVDRNVVEYYGELSDVILDLRKLKNAGVCK